MTLMRFCCGLLALMMIAAALFPALPQNGVLAQSNGSQGKAEEQCDHLPSPPGQAKGIERRCAAGSSSGVLAPISTMTVTVISRSALLSKMWATLSMQVLCT